MKIIYNFCLNFFLKSLIAQKANQIIKKSDIIEALNKYKKFITAYDLQKEKECDQILKKLTKQIKLLLYNNKSIPIKTKKIKQMIDKKQSNKIIKNVVNQINNV